MKQIGEYLTIFWGKYGSGFVIHKPIYIYVAFHNGVLPFGRGHNWLGSYIDWWKFRVAVNLHP